MDLNAKIGKLNLHSTQKTKYTDYLVGAFFMFCAFFMSACSLPFETYPFSLALLSASSKYIPFIFIGIIISIVADGNIDFLYLIAVFVIIISRLISRFFIEPSDRPKKLFSDNFSDTVINLFSESLVYRMLSATIGGFLIGLFRVVLNGFLYYDLFATLIYIFSSLILTFLYSPFFLKLENEYFFNKKEKTKGEKILYEISAFSILLSLVYSTKNIYLMGLSLSITCAFFLTFYYSKKGHIFASITSFLLGLVIKPIFAPLFFIVGLASSFTIYFSIGITTSIFCILGIIYTFWVGGISDFLSAFPAIITASLLYTTAEKIKLFDDIKLLFADEKKPSAVLNEKLAESEKSRFSDKKIDNVSKSFDKISTVFQNLGAKPSRLQLLDVRNICESSFDKYCPLCENRNVCYGVENEQMQDRINRLSASYHMLSKTNVEKLDKPFLYRCKNLDEIKSTIDSQIKEKRQKSLECKNDEFSNEFSIMSELIKSAIDENNREFRINKEMSEKLISILNAEGLVYSSAIVYGEHNLSLVIDKISFGKSIKLDDVLPILHKKIEKSLGFKFSKPEIEVIYGLSTIRMHRQQKYQVDYSSFEIPKTNNEKCGDSAINFLSENGYFYSIISDGMGSGERANEVSTLCTSFLEKMLTYGNSKLIAIKMLNNLLRNKNQKPIDEISTSIDLFELDLYNGTLNLTKCGASFSYLYRNKKLTKLYAYSFPIGIIDEIDAKEIRLKVEEGDIFIMVSDGVEISKYEDWLSNILSESDLQKTSDIGEKINEFAKKVAGNDDISFNVLRIDGYFAS